MGAFCSACGRPLVPEVKFCGECGAATNPITRVQPPPTLIGNPSTPKCQTCGMGSLRLEKRYRMSTPVVAIGFIILIPSVLFVIICVVTMFRVAALPTSDGSSMATGIMFFFAIGAFVSGLLGWLLIMKKKVLSCTHCSAIVPAS